MTALQLLIMQERWDLLDVVLEYPSISLDAVDEYSNSILHYVVLHNNVAIMDKLLKLNVNVNQKNFEGEEPIHACVYTDSLECFVAILNKSGRPETHEDHIVSHKNSKNENCLTMSIVHRAYKIFSYCLAFMKKLEYTDEHQKYPIHYIIDSNNYEFLEAFLKRSPNLRITNSNKENPLFYCLRHNKTAFFKVSGRSQETRELLRRRVSVQQEQGGADPHALRGHLQQPRRGSDTPRVQS